MEILACLKFRGRDRPRLPGSRESTLHAAQLVVQCLMVSFFIIGGATGSLTRKQSEDNRAHGFSRNTPAGRVPSQCEGHGTAVRPPTRHAGEGQGGPHASFTPAESISGGCPQPDRAASGNDRPQAAVLMRVAPPWLPPGASRTYPPMTWSSREKREAAAAPSWLSLA